MPSNHRTQNGMVVLMKAFICNTNARERCRCRYFLRMNGSSRGSIPNTPYKNLHLVKSSMQQKGEKRCPKIHLPLQNKCPRWCNLSYLCLNSLTRKNGKQSWPSLSHHYDIIKVLHQNEGPIWGEPGSH